MIDTSPGISRYTLLLTFVLSLLISIVVTSVFWLPIFTNEHSEDLTLAMPNNQNLVDYFVAANEFSHAGLIANDMCIAENDGKPFTRFNVNYALYGIIFTFTGNAFVSHLIGNFVLTFVTIFLAALVFVYEFGDVSYGITWGTLLYFETHPFILERIYQSLPLLVSGNIFSAFALFQDVSPPGLNISRTFAYLIVVIFHYLYLSPNVSNRVKFPALSVILAFSIYVHIYLAYYVIAVSCFMALIHWMQNNRDWVQYVKAIALSTIGLVPFYLNTTAMRNITLMADLYRRNAIYTSPSILIPSLAVVITYVVFIVIVRYSKRSNEFRMFAYSNVLAGLSATMVHNIIGVMPNPLGHVHFIYMFLVPMAVILLVRDYLPKISVNRSSRGFALLLVVIFITLLTNVSSAYVLRHAFEQPTKFLSAEHWLMKNSQRSDVILVEYSLQRELMSKLPANMYFCHPFFTIASDLELAQRIIEGNRALGKENNETAMLLQSLFYPVPEQTNIFGRILHNPWYEYPVQHFYRTHDEYVDFIKNVTAITAPSGFSHKIDFVLVRNGHERYLGTGQVVFNNTDYIIYKV